MARLPVVALQPQASQSTQPQAAPPSMLAMLEGKHAARAALVAAEHVRTEAERGAFVAGTQRAPLNDGPADGRVVQAISPARRAQPTVQAAGAPEAISPCAA